MMVLSLPRLPRAFVALVLCASAHVAAAQTADCPPEAAADAAAAGTACAVPHPLELPLPSSTLLMGIGALGIAAAMRKKK